MKKGNATAGDDAATEATAVAGEGEVQGAEKLSLRDALEVAYEATKEPSSDAGEAAGDGAEGAGGGAAATADAGGTNAAPGDGAQGAAQSPFEPPAEWNSEEKEDFRNSSRKAQEAALRLHRSRQAKVEEIKREKAELEQRRADYDSLKRLADDVNPYLQALGVKEASPVAIQKALKMWREFEDGDPKLAAAAYLQAKGIKVPPELIAAQQKDPTDEKITPLLQKVSELENRLAQEDRRKTEAVLQSAWASFEQTKNAAGTLKYPDIANGEAGLRLASNIGSLVSGRTDISKQFIALARERIPDLSFERLCEEAYRYLGGRVDSSEAARTQATQAHLAKSNRAAASRRGSGAQTASSGQVRKFKTYREAAAAAIADLSE